MFNRPTQTRARTPDSILSSESVDSPIHSHFPSINNRLRNHQYNDPRTHDDKLIEDIGSMNRACEYPAQESALSSSSSLIPPELPDFTKTPKSADHKMYNVSPTYSRNASVSFFSDEPRDEIVYNEVLIDEDEGIDEAEEEEGISYIESVSGTPEPGAHDDDNSLTDVQPSSPLKKSLYTTEIPVWYNPLKLDYPGTSPLEYTDEEFSTMNHFDFLHSVNLEEPPLLPVYLNSNLLNDSSKKNYKTYPYQYQESNHVYINEIYRYKINELSLMDKYSTMKTSNPARPEFKRSGSNSGGSSSSSIRSAKNLKHIKPKGNNSKPKVKHSDRFHQFEQNMVPHHVMLNHLITCNLNRDGYIIGSCITRYKGKFITQIMYFSNELEDPN